MHARSAHGAIEPGIRRIDVPMAMVAKDFHQIGDRFGALGQTLGSRAPLPASRHARLDRVAMGSGEAGNRQAVGNAARTSYFLDGMQPSGGFQHEGSARIGDDETIVVSESPILETASS